MPVFEYSALDSKGKRTSGIIDAESLSAARQKIRNAGNFPVDIKEIQDTDSPRTSRNLSLTRFIRRIKPIETAMMTRQLATLLNAGLPLVTAMDTLTSQIKTHSFKTTLAQIKDAVVEGTSFADALNQFPGTFSSLYINMVRAGESSGTLEIVLERLADITEKQNALTHRIQSAMTYPVFMVIVMVCVLSFLLSVVVPQLTTIFSDMDQSLPTPTIMLISISNFLKSFWWVLGILIIILCIAFYRFKQTPKGRHMYDKTTMRLPAIGNILKKMAISRFSRTLGSLLDNGVPMLSALGIVKNISSNSLISRAVEAASENVGKGQGLGSSLAESRVFPSLPIQMIQVGEQSGELEKMLYKIADIYDNEVEMNILSLTTLLEPVIILVMASVVLFIVISIILPIIEMNQLVL